MAPKRPHDAGAQSGDEVKRPRTSGNGDVNGGQVGAAAVRPAAPAGTSYNAQLAAIQAAAAAATRAKPAAAPGRGSSGVPLAAATSSMPARPVLPSTHSAAPSSAPSAGSSFDAAAIQKKIAEAKEKAQAMLSKAQLRNNDAKPSGIHPLLMGSTAKGGVGASNGSNVASSSSSVSSASRHVAPKFSTLSANARLAATQGRASPLQAVEQPATNPYLQAQTDGEESDETSLPRTRNRRKGLVFHVPGRHIRAAEDARHEAHMEALRRKIEEDSRKAGLSELTAEQRMLRRPVPPDIEWWDQALLPDSSYDAVKSLDKGKEKVVGDARILIEGEGSPIDIYIQHPIPIPAPSDKIKVQPRGVMLTKKEQKKMRKMRRQAEREDKQDQIKMGLLPPDAPKVKLSNLMRVLASESVADPTKIEARVRREIAARKEQHEQTNLDRMLTPEQRREKLEAAKQQDMSKGVYTLAFKVRHLVSPSHKFKVRKNALQFGLTGMTVFGPNFALIVVEGGQKSIKAYRRLMTVRIDWTDPKRPRADGDDELGMNGIGSPVPSEGSRLGSAGPAPAANAAEQEEIARIDWTQNYCHLIFEGPLRERNFGYGFKARTCETDGDAKETLGPKLASFWDLAKREEQAMAEEGGL